MSDFVFVRMTGFDTIGRELMSEGQYVPLSILPAAVKAYQDDHAEIVRVVFDIQLDAIEPADVAHQRRQNAEIEEATRRDVRIAVPREPMLSSITRPGSIAKPKIKGKPKQTGGRVQSYRLPRIDAEINRMGR